MEFTLKTIINAAPERIYRSWLSSEGHSKMTGSEASISDVIGAAFTAWDGYITGKNLQLDPFHHIIQNWRTTEFKENEPDSQIEIHLRPINDQTELTLIHSNLPAHGEQYRSGWDIHYFQPMNAYF